jgi:hypothetical protein
LFGSDALAADLDLVPWRRPTPGRAFRVNTVVPGYTEAALVTAV